MFSSIAHQPIIQKFNTSGVNHTFENWNCLSIFKKCFCIASIRSDTHCYFLS